MCSALPCDSDWRTQTKVYLEIPAGNMKRIGLNRFCKRHMRIPVSVVQFERFWWYVRNILVCQKGEGEDPSIVKILWKPVMAGIARPWPPSESGTIGYVSAENRSTGECFYEGLGLSPFGKAHLSQMFSRWLSLCEICSSLIYHTFLDNIFLESFCNIMKYIQSFISTG